VKKKYIYIYWQHFLVVPPKRARCTKKENIRQRKNLSSLGCENENEINSKENTLNGKSFVLYLSGRFLLKSPSTVRLPYLARSCEVLFVSATQLIWIRPRELGAPAKCYFIDERTFRLDVARAEGAR